MISAHHSDAWDIQGINNVGDIIMSTMSNEMNVIESKKFQIAETLGEKSTKMGKESSIVLERFPIATNLGKQVRLNRIFDPSGGILAVPMDHGFTLGPITGLTNPFETVRKVVTGGASCVMVHKGLVRLIHGALRRDTALLVHVSGSTKFSPRGNRKIQTGTVTEALRMGADGISCHVNLGASEDVEMLQDLALLTKEADDFGLPLLAMMYVRDDDGNEQKDPTSLAHAARVAEEAGADIVKINATPKGQNFDEVTQGIHIPIVIAGGAKSDDFEGFLETIRRCIEAGAAGVSVGRNIFQAKDPGLAMKKVAETIRAALS